MRHETPFPKPENELLSFFNDAWTNGLLDKYPDDHFIIEALNSSITDLGYLKQLINHNAASYYTPMFTNGEIDYSSFSENFIINLSTKLSALSKRFAGSKFNGFIADQLAAVTNDGKFSKDGFLQALSEIEILTFFSRCNWDEYVYEKPIGENGSNPEATFVRFDGDRKININIEVKTPEFTSSNDKTKKILPAFLLSETGRKYYQNECRKYNIDYVSPRVTKLAEFLESATKKFNFCSENEINILFINWTYTDIEYGGFLEAWSILANNVNGLLNHKEIATALPFKTKITDETYKKISAVVVYTSSLDEMMFGDFRHVWITHPYINHHFRLFILDENPQVISKIQSVTGMNQDMIPCPILMPIEPFQINTYDDIQYSMLFEMLSKNIGSSILTPPIN